MCYHIVTFVEYGCTHKYPKERHYIDCNTTRCRLSSFHRRDAHRCLEICVDMMLPDTGLIMESLRGTCPRCVPANAIGSK
ncbi:hypothetical protein B0H21DRAFT_762456 [Amylocystis lapponica]|nr:hypothetical protein B0H21DRAFT_762456 [Amylocystis lapponica]